MLRFVTVLLLFMLLQQQHMPAQVSTEIDHYNAVSPARAIDIASGLGTNVTADDEPEFRLAAAAGMKYVRFDAPWNTVESYSAPGSYTVPADVATGFRLAAKHHLSVYVNALYGPPSNVLAQAITATTTPVGSRTMRLINSSALASAVPGQTYVQYQGQSFVIGNTQIGMGASTMGSLIQSINQSTVTFAGTVNAQIPAGATVSIVKALYPPVLVQPGTSLLANSSLKAFANYAAFLGKSCHAAGVSHCVVSLWNEPPWPYEFWDNAVNGYTTPPPNANTDPTTGLQLPLLALYISQQPPPGDWTYDNGYTEKGGLYSSVYFPPFQSPQFNAARAVANFSSESDHPYGVNPEESLWKPACMQQYAQQYGLYGVALAMNDCDVSVSLMSSAFKGQAGLRALPANDGGSVMAVTETGLQRSVYPGITESQVALFNLRQFLGMTAVGVHPWISYRLTDSPDFQWCTGKTETSCLPIYKAFQGMIADIGSIANAPVTVEPTTSLPSISTYTGSYPLSEVQILGATSSSARRNSVIEAVWQQTYTADFERGSWPSISSPAAAPVAIHIPSGTEVKWVKDWKTGLQVNYRLVNSVLTVMVQDDPVAILMEPAGT